MIFRSTLLTSCRSFWLNETCFWVWIFPVLLLSCFFSRYYYYHYDNNRVNDIDDFGAEALRLMSLREQQMHIIGMNMDFSIFLSTVWNELFTEFIFYNCSDFFDGSSLYPFFFLLHFFLCCCSDNDDDDFIQNDSENEEFGERMLSFSPSPLLVIQQLFPASLLFAFAISGFLMTSIFLLLPC